METTLYEISCCKCKVLFWVAKTHNNRLRKSHEFFYCPNGHSQSYVGDTCEEKLKRTKRHLQDANDDRDGALRSNSALRGVITKLKKRHN